MSKVALKDCAEKYLTVEITYLSPVTHPNVGWPKDLKVGCIVTGYIPKIKYLMDVLDADEDTALSFQKEMEEKGILVIYDWYNELDEDDPLIITKEGYRVL